MSHPDLDRLTAWVHALLEPGEARTLEDHVLGCAACRDLVEQLREEAQAIEDVIAPDPRLMQRILATPSAPARRAWLWQAPLAAALLLGLIALLLPPGPSHRLVAGRVTFGDGRELAAPAELSGSGVWDLRVPERAGLLLSDRTTIDLEPGSRIGLDAGGDRGTRIRLAAGEAAFAVAREPRRLEVSAPAGRIESNEGTFKVRIVSEGGSSMNPLIAGALVTVLSGSASLANERGEVRIEAGQAAVLARAQAPLRLAVPQDAEALLKRLEQLAARVAKLEDEIARLETRNKQLKGQLDANVPGGAVWSAGGGNGVRVVTGAAQGQPGASVILEVEEKKDK